MIFRLSSEVSNTAAGHICGRRRSVRKFDERIRVGDFYVQFNFAAASSLCVC
jgi:hypothetical protein